MAFRRAILPVRLISLSDKPVMIGNTLEHIPNSLPMLHLLYRLYGRTILRDTVLNLGMKNKQLVMV